MKELLTVGVVVLQGLGAAFAASRIDISGTTKEISPGATAVSVAAQSAATVKLLAPASGTSATYAVNIDATNCVVTLDASDVRGLAAVQIDGDLWGKGADAKLIVTGLQTLRFGESVRWGATSTSFDLCSIPVEFEEQGGEIVFVNNATLERDPGCVWSVADGAMLALAGSGLLGTPGEPLVLDRYDIALLAGDALKSSSIVVKSGYNLVVKYCTINVDHAWSGSNSIEPSVYPVRLEQGSTMVMPAKTANAFNGPISGSGSISVGLGASFVTFGGDNSSFAGTLEYAVDNFTVSVADKMSCGTLKGRTGATLSLGTDAVFSAGRLEGSVSWAGVDKCQSLAIGSLADGMAVKFARSAPVTVGGATTRTFVGGHEKVYVGISAENGQLNLSAAEALLSSSDGYELEMSDGLSYVNVPESVRLVAKAGVSAAVKADERRIDVNVAATASVAVSDNAEGWKAHVSHWIDPNVTSSLAGFEFGDDLSAQMRGDRGMPWYSSGSPYAAIFYLTDVREDKRTWVYQCEKVFSNSTTDIHPVLVPNALNGLSVISCGAGYSARRVSYYDVSPKQTKNTTSRGSRAKEKGVQAKFAVLVFGSQGGGGQGLFGTGDGYFARGGTNDVPSRVSDINYCNKDQPIFKSKIPTWVDGESVDATTTAFSGGWQILSVDCSGTTSSIHSLGCANNNETKGNCGGQVYGEVIFFDEVLDDRDRCNVERYLAAKWGLADQYKGPAAPKVQVRASGAGALTFASDAELEGGFAGTVDAGAHTLTVSSLPVPPTDAVVTAAKPDFWFDPEYPEALVAASNVKRISKLYDRSKTMPPEGDMLYLYGCGREPFFSVGSRGGWAQQWVSHIGGTCNLRFKKVSDDVADASVDNPRSVRTVFLVQDSTYGGGTPFNIQKTSAGVRVPNREAGEQPTGHEVDIPIWPTWTSYQGLRDSSKATTYLDGRPVDGTVCGFGGKPEIFSVVSDAPFKVGCFGNLYYNNAAGTPYPDDCGEIQSEILLFYGKISEENRAKIEAYLAWKWLGEVREGYTSLHAAKLTGSGVVTIPAGAAVPQLGADFTGTANFATNRFEFTVTTKDPTAPVDGLIDVGGGTFAPQSPCTLAVTLATGVKLKSNSFYPLVRGIVAEDVELALSVDPSVAAAGRDLKLETRDGVLGLAVGSNGILLIVR